MKFYFGVFFSSFNKRLRKVIRNIERVLFKLRFQINIAPKKYCYISQNCIGGKFYQIERRSYSSPTVGLWFEASDFLTFCENLSEYLTFPLLEDIAKSKEMAYPVGKLGEIKIYFLHYSSFQLAKKDWERRVERVDLNKVFVLTTDRDGFSNDDLARFQKLPTKRKILFSSKFFLNMNNIIYVPGYENQSHVGDLVGNFNNLIQVKIRKKLFKLLNI
jgi:uncharacterized protein (DUF1919 family)